MACGVLLHKGGLPIVLCARRLGIIVSTDFRTTVQVCGRKYLNDTAKWRARMSSSYEDERR